LLLLPLLAARPATSADAAFGQHDAADGSDTVLAAEAVDGDTLLLEDGRQLRLVGVQAPRLDAAEASRRTLAQATKAKLEELAAGKRLRLFYGGQPRDRHGRLLAHGYLPDGRWLQGELLRLGLVRTYTFADNRALIAEMLALEEQARAAGLGIWGDPSYRIRHPDEAAGLVDSFQLVQGRIEAAAVVRGRGYLNFGPDWRTDFTVSLEPQVVRDFVANGTPVETLAGHTVRARGWIESFNGPMIDVTHPEQIELLSAQ
jgi:endonuclease YncB( thermonuclease family)